MTPYTLIILITFVAALVIASRADGKNPNLKTRTAEAIVATWHCQDKIPMTRTDAYSPWKPHSHKFRVAQLNLWTLRLAACRKILASRIPTTNDWRTAVALVQRVYPGTQEWLLRISHREGGWGGFVMNHQGSGCGGWMQFMSSTYWAYSHAAYQDTQRRGWRVDPTTNNWTHPLGQALTAGYMRFTGRDGHHWALTSY